MNVTGWCGGMGMGWGYRVVMRTWGGDGDMGWLWGDGGGDGELP